MIFITVFSFSCSQASEKKADLAGTWYSADPDVLRREINYYLEAATPARIDGKIIGFISPHAGLRFSGHVAAYGYKAAMPQSPKVVIVVGFSHRKYYDGISVFTEDAFVTPLGSLKINKEISKKLISSSEKIFSLPEAFSDENSVEMLTPFIQVAFKDAEAVLLAIGNQTRKNSRIIADAIYDAVKGRDDYLMIGSTDMCHYLPYDEANRRDKETISNIKRFKPDLLYDESERKRHELMCGFGAVYATMLASQKLGADEVQIFKYANSGDTSGMKQSVVGYLSAAFIKRKSQDTGHELQEKETGMFNHQQRKELLKIARDAIIHNLKTGKTLAVKVDDEALKQDMGAFVTLHKGGQLRGCIGNMVARGPLYLAVRDMAIAAAVEDPRFSPVRLEEMDDIDIEISALSPMERIDDYERIEVGKHGVMVRTGWRSGVYLPQVATETGWTREEFMNSLCAHKAGMPMDAWKTGGCEIYIFTAEVFGEKEQ